MDSPASISTAPPRSTRLRGRRAAATPTPIPTASHSTAPPRESETVTGRRLASSWLTGALL
jgi:hypothetical protein